MNRSRLVRWAAAAAATAIVFMVCGGAAALAAGEDGPARASQRGLTVRADPRVELLSLVFRLAGNPEYTRGQVASYAKDADEHFDVVKDHAVVRLARRLRAERGVSFDAVMAMAVHVDDAAKLGERVPFDPRPATLDARWQPDDARAFLAALTKFSEESSFDEFVKRHDALYRMAETRLAKVLD